MSKALYAGIPVRLCDDRECSCVIGFFSPLMSLIPFNGWFMLYDGSYLGALWHWLTHWDMEDGS